VPEASTPIFERDGERFLPTELARGPWDAQALHGGAPAALLARTVEMWEPGHDLFVSRLTYEFLRPVPLAPLEVSVETLRPGRRAQLVGASLRSGGDEVCRLTALRLARPPASAVIAEDTPAPPGPQQGRPITFSLAPTTEVSFAASAMRMRFVAGEDSPGPATVWLRLAHPLLRDEPASPLVRVVAAADFGNGVGAALDFERFVFINADLTVHLHRAPEGEWVCLDAVTRISAGAGAMAESRLYDERGPIGRAVQSLVVGER
jgi:acyl-CoA thioesterase